MENKQELHKRIDAKYAAMMEELAPAYEMWSTLAVMRMWGAEKAYLERYGHPYPEIVNAGA